VRCIDAAKQAIEATHKFFTLVMEAKLVKEGRVVTAMQE
jgi:hypothetical protein